MNKKGFYFFDMGWRVWHIIVFSVMTVVIFLMISSLNSYDVKTFDQEADIFWSIAMNSKHGIGEYDSDIKRVYPTVIDFEKFSKKGEMEKNLMDIVDLQNRFSTKFNKTCNNYIAAKIILDVDTDHVELFYNEVLFRKIFPIGEVGTLGAGQKGVNRATKIFPVTVLNNPKGTDGTITFEIFKPKDVSQYAIC